MLATQNPLEMEGTYPLPEAQLDRFLFKLKLDFPSVEHLHEIMERTTQADEPTVTRVLDGEQIVEMRKTARSVLISKPGAGLCHPAHPGHASGLGARGAGDREVRALRRRATRHPGARAGR